MTGLLHIYTGDGKGKTSAATGLAVRFAGSGHRVLYAQFLKSNDSCELYSMEQIENIDLIRCERCFGFTFRMSEETKDEAGRFYTEYFRRVIASVKENETKTAYGLLILDELVTAFEKGLVDRAVVLEFLKNKPEGLEVAMTGRGASAELLALADYVTEMKKVKHPFDKGIGARRGIEK